MLKIRPATLDDLEPIREIYNDAVLNTVATFDTVPKSPEDQRRWFGEHAPRYPVIVAELEGIVVGWASLSRWSDRPAYDGTAEVSVYVDADHREKKIGSALLEALVEAGQKGGFHNLVSRIVEGSDVSIHLHERLGFAHVGVLREAGRKFGKMLDVTIMQKVLESGGAGEPQSRSTG
jgi:phosphinothricin acetyltransferase